MAWKEKGSGHYRTGAIQPWEYIQANGLDFWEGNVVKYITRWRNKGTPIEDLNKLIHYAEYLKETWKETHDTQITEQILKQRAKQGDRLSGWLRRLFKRNRFSRTKKNVSNLYGIVR